MGEVGEQGPAWHAEIGAYAKQRGIGALLALGSASLNAVHAFGVAGEHFADPLRLIDTLRARMHANQVVLIKGSRFMQMERIVDALTLGESH
jgi:UDP-N-acetylmuramoyl-tripeptide--D-alanyl-D-alanine ligase